MQDGGGVQGGRRGALLQGGGMQGGRRDARTKEGGEEEGCKEQGGGINGNVVLVN